MTRLAQGVYALLVAATFAAFFLAQRLKHSPTLVQSFTVAPSFTPIRGSSDPRERISFRIKVTDYVTVSVLDTAGQRVAVLVHGLPLKAYHTVVLYWSGHTSSGAPAPAGSYEVRVSLRRQNHSVVPPGTFRLLAPPGAGRT